MQRIIDEQTSYGPQEVGCRLSELAEEKKLGFMNVRDHVRYRVVRRDNALHQVLD